MSAITPDSTAGMTEIKIEDTTDLDVTNELVKTTTIAMTTPGDDRSMAEAKIEDAADSGVTTNAVKTTATLNPSAKLTDVETSNLSNAAVQAVVNDASVVPLVESSTMVNDALMKDTSTLSVDTDMVNGDSFTTRSVKSEEPSDTDPMPLASPVPTAMMGASPSDTTFDELRAAQMNMPAEEQDGITQSDDETHGEILTLPKASAIGLEDRDLPTTAEAINDPKRLNAQPKMTWGKTVLNCVMQLRKKNPERPLSTEQKQNVFDILKSIEQLEIIPPDREEGFKFILNAIMGETRRIKEPYSFPDPFPECADIVMKRVARLLHYEAPLSDETTTPSPPTTPVVAAKKRKRSAPSVSQSTQGSTLNIDDPEVQKVMFNITRGQKTGRKTYKIADPSKAVPHNVWGNNGLKVGSWFPYRLNALQAGAHGSAQGGIAGGAQEGAKSIVVGGGYYEEDNDEGHTIYFSGTSTFSDANAAATNEHKGIPQVTNATKSMQLSLKNKRPIRVLRASNGSSRFAPSCGFRYDGLYKIIEQMDKVNKKGGKYIEFKLERMGRQDPIDLSHPSQRERDIFATLKNMA